MNHFSKLIALVLSTCLSSLQTVCTQQVNGQFVPFAYSSNFANTGMNDLLVESNGTITVAGYYEGVYNVGTTRMPMAVTISNTGNIIEGWMHSYINNNGIGYGNNAIQRIVNYANPFYIFSGAFSNNDVGYITKTSKSSARPTQFNTGNLIFLDGGGPKSYVEDVVRVGTSSFYVARYSGSKVVVSAYNATTGALVASFGTGGTTELPYPSASMNGIKMLRRTDGSFYVAYSDGSRLAVCKLKNNGTLDSSFFDFGFTEFASGLRVKSLVVNTNGDVIAGGTGFNTAMQLPSIGSIRFFPSGALQLVSFGHAPDELRLGIGSSIEASVPAGSADDSIVVVAASHMNGTNKRHIMIDKYNPGNLEEHLNVTPWLPAGAKAAWPSAILKLTSGSFIVSGYIIRSNDDTAGVVLKFNPDGTIDQSFGENGACIINAVQGGQGWSDVAQLPSGKYLAAGTATYMTGNAGKRAIVLNRFHENGEPDNSFGDNGTIYAHLSTDTRTVRKVVALDDGSFIAGGTYKSASYSNSTKAAVFKFLANGDPDPDFGTGGVCIVPYLGFEEMKVTDSVIYVGGDHSSSAKSCVARISLSGTVLSYLFANYKYFTHMEPNNSGGVFIGRYYTSHTNVVCKVNAGGTPDPGFGLNGEILLTAIGATGTNCYVEDMHKLDNGNLLVLRQWYESSGSNVNSNLYFSIILPNGKVDSSFGTLGNKLAVFPNTTSVAAEKYRWVQQGTKLLVFGNAIQNGITKGYIARFDQQGELDPDYGNGGIVWLQTTFTIPFNFNRTGDLVGIGNRFLSGSYLAKLEVPFTVYQPIDTVSWVGGISVDWFDPNNWGTHKVPDIYTHVVISGGQCIIPPNQTAFAYSIQVNPGASFTIGQNSTLVLYGKNDNP